MNAAPAIRATCPVCGRSIALTARGRLYRHDPPERGRDLLSCWGSLKVVRPPGGQLPLFPFILPPPDVPGPGDDEDDDGALF